MSLYKFNYISLLKNDGQLKQKSNKKKAITQFIKKKKSCLVFFKKKAISKKGKGKKRTSNMPGKHKKRKKKRKKKKEKNGMNLAHATQAFLSIKHANFPPIFSQFWGKIFLVGLGRKHLSSKIYFSSSPLNQTHSNEVFLLIFFPKFSLYHISPSNKHTLKVLKFGYVLHPKIYVLFEFKPFHSCTMIRCKLNATST